MHAQPQELENLLEIQSIDLDVMQARKKRTELPQRIEVMRLRKKREEIQSKLDQVYDLLKEAESEMTAVEDEDRSLVEKQDRTQELINESSSDFRKVESHTKDLAGIAKRREALAETRLAIEARIAKINGVKSQIEEAIAVSEAEEARLRSEFEGEDGELAEHIRMRTAEREKIAATVSPDIMDAYAKIAAKMNGVAVGKLEEDETCGVCRTGIEGGHLIALKAQAPLGICPNCKRLLVVV